MMIKSSLQGLKALFSKDPSSFVDGVASLSPEDVPSSGLLSAMSFSVAESLLAGFPLVVLYAALVSLSSHGPDVVNLVIWSLFLLVSLVLQSICSVRAGVGAGVFAFELGAAARLRLGEHLRQIPAGILQSTTSGSRVEALLLDVSNLETSFAFLYGKIAACIAPPAVFGLLLLFLDPAVGGLLIATLPLGALYLIAVGRRMERTSEAMLDAKRAATTGLLEYVYGIMTIRSLGLEDRNTSSLRSALDDLTGKSIRLEAVVLPLVEIYGVIVSSGMVLLIVFGSLQYASGSLSLALFLLLLVVSLKFYQPVSLLGGYFSLIRYLTVSFGNIKSLFGIPLQASGSGQFPRDNPSIEFEDVHFSYSAPSGEAGEVLRGVSFSIPAGKTLAIVGPSGAGKSTVLSLLQRFHDAGGGAVRIGGHDVKSFSLESLHAGIAHVPQNPHFFNATVAENLRMAKSGASDAQMWDALEMAGLAGVVRSLPSGLDSVLGPGAARLSGGEKRRLALARALLHDAPVLLLDEATASLDLGTERSLAALFRKLSGKKTIVTVAHRLKTVRYADMILFLENGRVVERGSHEELIQKNGRYAHFWNLQQQIATWKLK